MNIISLSHKEIVVNKALVKAVFVISFIMLTALGAYVRIPLPFSPVPITMQTFFVILGGAVLGRKLGVFAQGSYVGLGLLGLPIFQGYGAGLIHMTGPTGGYLLGFIASSFIIGLFLNNKQASQNFYYSLFAMAAGLITIYAFGISWLIVGYNCTLLQAASLGFIPFIPGAILKLIAASWVYSKIRYRTDPLVN